MTTILFLAEWAVRSSVLIMAGALLLRVLRVTDASVRLAAWVMMLIGSLGLPLLTTVLPSVRVTKTLIAVSVPARPQAAVAALPHAPFLVRDVAPAAQRTVLMAAREVRSFPWTQAALSVYFLGAGLLVLRLFMGIILSRRLLRTSQDTGLEKDGIPIRESTRVASPVALGIVQPVILLPTDWREWDAAQFDAVLAHEGSHIQRRDPAVQFTSALHRALLWHSPLSWFLHQRLVRVAEEASDDAAVSVTRDRASYAELLLEFVQRASGQGNRGALDSQGVAMARYGRLDARISRILDGASLSRGVTRWSALAILALGVPLAFVVAAPQLPETPAAPSAPTAPARPAAPGGIPVAPQTPVAPQAPVAPAAPSAVTGLSSVQVSMEQGGPSQRTIRRYLIVSGDSVSGSWDSSDGMDQAELREKYGPRFAWFLSGGHDYVVTDAGVLEELRLAMAPQNEVNRLQGEVNKQQDVVNQHQETVNAAQNAVNKMQDGANQRQDLINQLQEAKGNEDLLRKLEAALAELRAHKGEAPDQDSVNREQSKVNATQEGVNEEQGKVNAQQEKVNQEQQRVSAKYKGRVEAILESALQRHVAQEIK